METGPKEHRRKKTIWVIGGVLAGIVALGLLFGSLFVAYVYQSVSGTNMQINKPPTLEVAEEQGKNIRISERGEFFFDGNEISGADIVEKKEKLHQQIETYFSTPSVSERKFVILEVSEATTFEETKEIINWVLEVGGEIQLKEI